MESILLLLVDKAGKGLRLFGQGGENVLFESDSFTLVFPKRHAAVSILFFLKPIFRISSLLGKNR
jgi:hypothetical protein